MKRARRNRRKARKRKQQLKTPRYRMFIAKPEEPFELFCYEYGYYINAALMVFSLFLIVVLQ